MAYDGTLKFDTLMDVKGFQKGADSIGGIVKGMAGFKLIEKGFQAIVGSMDAAISRYDTLNRFPKIMEQMGYGAASGEKAIKKLSDGIQGLPTALDEITGNTQRLAIATGDLDKGANSALALNNAMLASGASSDVASRGAEQYIQALSRGSIEGEEWKTLLETMPYALQRVAESFDHTGTDGVQKLRKSMQDGEITMSQFNDRLIEIDTGMNGFAEVAKTATGGIGTAWTNLKTAMVRGTTNIIESIDRGLSKTRFQNIEGIINQMKNGIIKALDVVAKAFEFVAEHIELIIPVVAGVAAAFAAFKIAQWAQGLQGSITDAVKAVVELFKDMDAAAKATIIGAIVGIGVALAALAEAFLGASQATEDYKNEMESLADNTAAMATDFVAAENALARNADKARTLADGISILNDKITSGKLTAGELAIAQAELSAKTVEYNAAVGEEALKIDAATGAVVGGTAAIDDNTDALIENAKRQAAVTAYEDAYKALTQAQSEQAGALAKMKDLYPQLDKEQQALIDTIMDEYEATGSLAGVTDELNDLWYKSDIFGGQVNNELRGLLEGTKSATEAEAVATKQTEDLTGVIKENETARKSETTSIEEQETAIREMTTKSGMNLDMVAEKWGMSTDEVIACLLKQGTNLDSFNTKMKETHTDAGLSVEDLAAKWGVSSYEIEKWIAMNESDVQGWSDMMEDEFAQQKEVYDGYFTAVTDGFSRMEQGSAISMQKFMENMGFNQTATSNWADNMTALMAAGVDSGVIAKLHSMGDEGKATAQLWVDELTEMNGGTDIALGNLNCTAQGRLDELSGVMSTGATTAAKAAQTDAVIQEYVATGGDYAGAVKAGYEANDTLPEQTQTSGLAAGDSLGAGMQSSTAPTAAAQEIADGVVANLSSADFSAITTGIANAIRAGSSAVTSAASGMSTAVQSVFRAMSTQTQSISQQMMTGINTAITSRTGTVRASAAGIATAISTTLQSMVERGKTVAEQMMTGIHAITISRTDMLKTAASSIASGVEDNLRSMISGCKSIMNSTMDGMLVAMDDKAAALYAKAKGIANNIAKTMRTALDVHSPSRVMIKIFEFVMMGIYKGMDGLTGLLYRQAEDISTGIGDRLSVSPTIAESLTRELRDMVDANPLSEGSLVLAGAPSGAGGGVSYSTKLTQYITTPKPLSESELTREGQDLLRRSKFQLP